MNPHCKVPSFEHQTACLEEVARLYRQLRTVNAPRSCAKHVKSCMSTADRTKSGRNHKRHEWSDDFPPWTRRREASHHHAGENDDFAGSSHSLLD